MFNRYLYQKLETEANEKDKLSKLERQLSQRRKNKLETQVSKYKAKVRNFLVELASNPIELGQYIPPINNIERAVNAHHRMGAPQMFINGFKTNKDRIKRAEDENKILDYSPMKSTLKNQSFRERILNKEIQPTLRFAENRSLILLNRSYSQKLSPGQNSKITKNSQSLKNLKLPALYPDPQKKTYFKAIEEMGNSLKSKFLINKVMEQSENQRISLENRLMVVMDGKEAKVKETALDLLVKCKLLKKRVNSQRTLETLKTSSVKL